jgi:hypothetical protein
MFIVVHRAPITVELTRDPKTFNIDFHHAEDIGSILRGGETEEDFSRSIINRYEETTLRTPTFKPVMNASVEL